MTWWYNYLSSGQSGGQRQRAPTNQSSLNQTFAWEWWRPRIWTTSGGSSTPGESHQSRKEYWSNISLTVVVRFTPLCWGMGGTPSLTLIRATYIIRWVLRYSAYTTSVFIFWFFSILTVVCSQLPHTLDLTWFEQIEGLLPPPSNSSSAISIGFLRLESTWTKPIQVHRVPILWNKEERGIVQRIRESLWAKPRMLESPWFQDWPNKLCPPVYLSYLLHRTLLSRPSRRRGNRCPSEFIQGLFSSTTSTPA